MATTDASAFEAGKTLQEAAQAEVDDLYHQARIGRLDNTQHYGVTNRRVKEYLLSGGGPGSNIAFVFTEGEISGAYFSYSETSGIATVWVDHYQAELIYNALTSEPQPPIILTVTDENGAHVTRHDDLAEAHEALRNNYAVEEEDLEGDALIQFVESQGVTVEIDEP